MFTMPKKKKLDPLVSKIAEVKDENQSVSS